MAKDTSDNKKTDNDNKLTTSSKKTGVLGYIRGFMGILFSQKLVASVLRIAAVVSIIAIFYPAWMTLIVIASSAAAVEFLSVMMRWAFSLNEPVSSNAPISEDAKKTDKTKHAIKADELRNIFNDLTNKVKGLSKSSSWTAQDYCNLGHRLLAMSAVEKAKLDLDFFGNNANQLSRINYELHQANGITFFRDFIRDIPCFACFQINAKNPTQQVAQFLSECEEAGFQRLVALVSKSFGHRSLIIDALEGLSQSLSISYADDSANERSIRVFYNTLSSIIPNLSRESEFTEVVLSSIRISGGISYDGSLLPSLFEGGRFTTSLTSLIDGVPLGWRMLLNHSNDLNKSLDYDRLNEFNNNLRELMDVAPQLILERDNEGSNLLQYMLMSIFELSNGVFDPNTGSYTFPLFREVMQGAYLPQRFLELVEMASNYGLILNSRNYHNENLVQTIERLCRTAGIEIPQVIVNRIDELVHDEPALRPRPANRQEDPWHDDEFIDVDAPWLNHRPPENIVAPVAPIPANNLRGFEALDERVRDNRLSFAAQQNERGLDLRVCLQVAINALNVESVRAVLAHTPSHALKQQALTKQDVLPDVNRIVKRFISTLSGDPTPRQIEILNLLLQDYRVDIVEMARLMTRSLNGQPNQNLLDGVSNTLRENGVPYDGRIDIQLNIQRIRQGAMPINKKGLMLQLEDTRRQAQVRVDAENNQNVHTAVAETSAQLHYEAIKKVFEAKFIEEGGVDVIVPCIRNQILNRLVEEQRAKPASERNSRLVNYIETNRNELISADCSSGISEEFHNILRADRANPLVGSYVALCPNSQFTILGIDGEYQPGRKEEHYLINGENTYGSKTPSESSTERMCYYFLFCMDYQNADESSNKAQKNADLDFFRVIDEIWNEVSRANNYAYPNYEHPVPYCLVGQVGRFAQLGVQATDKSLALGETLKTITDNFMFNHMDRVIGEQVESAKSSESEKKSRLEVILRPIFDPEFDFSDEQNEFMAEKEKCWKESSAEDNSAVIDGLESRNRTFETFFGYSPTRNTKQQGLMNGLEAATDRLLPNYQEFLRGKDYPDSIINSDYIRNVLRLSICQIGGRFVAGMLNRKYNKTNLEEEVESDPVAKPKSKQNVDKSYQSLLKGLVNGSTHLAVIKMAEKRAKCEWLLQVIEEKLNDDSSDANQAIKECLRVFVNENNAHIAPEEQNKQELLDQFLSWFSDNKDSHEDLTGSAAQDTAKAVEALSSLLPKKLNNKIKP